MVDTALFKWGARIFAGTGILSAGWHLKDQRFGLAVISVIGSILLVLVQCGLRISLILVAAQLYLF